MNTSFSYNGYQFTDNDKFKTIHFKDFNLFFNKETGYAERWGKTRDDEDDPVYSPIGPTIVDIELSKDIHDNEIENYKNEFKVEGKTCLGKCKMCCPPNTKILLSNDTEKNIQDITVGDIVYSYNDKLKKLSTSQVIETYLRDYDGILINIELEDGNVLKLTEDHPIYTLNRGWISAKDLTNDDEILSIL